MLGSLAARRARSGSATRDSELATWCFRVHRIWSSAPLLAANQIAIRSHTSLRLYSGQDHRRHDPDVVEVVRTCGSGFRALLPVYMEFMNNQKSSNLNLQKLSNPLG